VILTIFTAVGIIFSRQLVGMIAPGFGADPVRFELAVSFTRLTFAYLFAYRRLFHYDLDALLA